MITDADGRGIYFPFDQRQWGCWIIKSENGE